jgi:hypothetical protein
MFFMRIQDMSMSGFFHENSRFAIPQNYSLRQRKGTTTPPAQNVLKIKVFYFIFRVLFRLHFLTGRLKEQLREKGETEQ